VAGLDYHPYFEFFSGQGFADYSFLDSAFSAGATSQDAAAYEDLLARELARELVQASATASAVTASSVGEGQSGHPGWLKRFAAYLREGPYRAASEEASDLA